MKIGMIGLGKMGGNMAERLVRAGHEVIGYAQHRETVESAAEKGIKGVTSLPDLISELDPPGVVWIMVPSGKPVDSVIEELIDLLEPGGVVIDGGNSNYRDTLRRSALLAENGIEMVDCGTSGGVWGLKEGYSMMVGGSREAVEKLSPIFEALAPAPDRGWGHVGPPGAGHFVKMVHNGIEYGMMQAMAEGFSILRHKEEFGLDLHQVAEIWRYGSVVRSWLLDLISAVFEDNPGLEEIAPYVEDSGEGRWTVLESLELDVPAPVITQALFERFRSREENSFSDRVLAALRDRFGGHGFRKETES
ncbi:MAG: decarboxylating 6-phosphogluconate dehydrogenase [Candidatus Krumholzibacteriales bacterium]